MTERVPGSAAAQEPFVTWTGVSVVLGDHIVLKDVNLDIRGTDFVAVLGPNGAGKSTLLRAICGSSVQKAAPRRASGRSQV